MAVISGRLSETQVREIAQHLLAAEAERRAVPGLESTHAKLDMSDAYRVQGELVALKEAAGHRLVGWKLGLTSKEKQKAMGVFAPSYGALLSCNLLDQAEFPLSKLIHPRVEPEIAVILGEDLAGPITPAQARAAIRWVLPALEIIDSRYQGFKFTLPDVVADNSSTALALVGNRPVSAARLDLTTIGVVFSKNGQMITTAAGAAVLGDPAIAIAWLAGELAGRGMRLKAGELIFTGALTAATPVKVGDVVEARFSTLGTVSVRVTDEQ